MKDSRLTWAELQPEQRSLFRNRFRFYLWTLMGHGTWSLIYRQARARMLGGEPTPGALDLATRGSDLALASNVVASAWAVVELEHAGGVEEVID